LLVAALIAVFAASCGGHGKSAATVETKSKPSLVVRLTATSHHPRSGKPWRYEVRVTDTSGKSVPANIHLQILFGGIPVGQVGRHQVDNGVWRETIGRGHNAPFPARARGQPLVFEAVVRAGGQTRKAHWWIRVR
jgi:hypothetical protein